MKESELSDWMHRVLEYETQLRVLWRVTRSYTRAKAELTDSVVGILQTTETWDFPVPGLGLSKGGVAGSHREPHSRIETQRQV